MHYLVRLREKWDSNNGLGSRDSIYGGASGSMKHVAVIPAAGGAPWPQRHFEPLELTETTHIEQHEIITISIDWK